MTKILKILQCTNLGGMEQSVYRILPRLDDCGLQFSIVTPRKFGEGEKYLKLLDPDALDNNYKGKFGYKSQAAFKDKVSFKSKDCDRAWVTGTDVASLRAIKDLAIPKLLGHHYHHFEGSGSWLKWKIFYESLCRQFDWITYPSDYVRNEAIYIAPWIKKRSSVVHFYFPIFVNDAFAKAQARSTFGIPEHAFIIGNAGWLIPRKRWDVFLDVAEIVLESIPESFFLIAGGGEQEAAMRERVNKMKHGFRIKFLGWQDDLDLFYRSLDVLLFNSDLDALGRTPGEAMGYGVIPVVSLLRGGLSDIVHDERDGFYFDSHDVVAMAKRIKELRNNPSLVTEMQLAGQETLRNSFSESSEVSFYLNELQS